MKAVRNLVWLGIFLFFVCVITIAGYRYAFPSYTAAQRTAAETAGASIVDAIESFRSDYGRYPRGLSELVPEYLSQDSLTHEKVRWEYERFSNSYRISLDQSKRWRTAVLNYYSINDTWDVDDGL